MEQVGLNNQNGNNDYDLMSFKYNGTMWCLTVALLNVLDSKTIIIQNTNLNLLEFCSQINSLLMTGSMIYTDEYGKLDKLLCELYSTCYVRFWKKIGDSKDDNTGFRIGTEELVFEHLFLILNINIVDRLKNVIKYKLDLISAELWVKCNNKVAYTNYHKDPEPITEIMKKLLLDNGFNIDGKSFDKCKTEVKIHYKTEANDTIMTALKYLFRRMYYDKDEKIDTSLKFLSYDPLNDKIYLADYSKDNTMLSETVVPMSCFDSSVEDMANLNNIQMASLNKVSKDDFLRTFEMHHPYKYDPAKNDFEDKKIDYKEMIKLFEKAYNLPDYALIDDKTNALAPIKDKLTDAIRDLFVSKADRWESYWNNDMNNYDEMMQSLLFNEGLVVSIDGHLELNNGGLFAIRVDRDLQGLQKLDGDLQDNILLERFRKFEGTWFVNKSRHIICPMARTYKTNLLLSRNKSGKITTY